MNVISRMGWESDSRGLLLPGEHAFSTFHTWYGLFIGLFELTELTKTNLISYYQNLRGLSLAILYIARTIKVIPRLNKTASSRAYVSWKENNFMFHINLWNTIYLWRRGRSFSHTKSWPLRYWVGEAGCDLVAAHQVHLQLSLPPGLVVAHVAREGVDVDPLQTFQEPNSLFICVQFSQHSEFEWLILNAPSAHKSNKMTATSQSFRIKPH